MRYLGIDYGSKKVGLALSDEGGRMGFPHAIVPNTPRLAADLTALIARERVEAVVIGESRDLLGGENAIASAARALGAELGASTGVPVYFEDESFTSAQAKRAQEPGEKTRKPRERSAVDASAAALILTNFLSHHEATH